jgi:hypothetical protein
MFAILLAAVTTMLSCACQTKTLLVQDEPRPIRDEPRSGRIEGTVLYKSGEPVKDATVEAHPLDRGLAGIIPHADTDEFGHFQITRLWLGKFAVTAKKETEGYPNRNGFYRDGKIDPTTLSPSHLSATVTIILGPKAGILIGTVKDAVTGAPLDPCVDFHRVSNPNIFLSGGGLVNAQYRVLVPADREVIMKIWNEGYLPWYYPGTTKKSEAKPLCLRAGEEKTLDIQLQPGSDPSDAGCNSSLCFPHCRP